MTARRIEIAGAGFTGLTLGAALAGHGWQVRIHEAAPEVRSFGAGIFLWENGLRVLDRLGILDPVLAGSHSAPAWEERTVDGTLLGRTPLPLPSGARMVTMTRHHLHSHLLDAALASGVEIVTDSVVTGASPEGILHLADEELRADVVVGADGVHSRVRDSLDLLAAHDYFDVGVFRFLVDRATLPAEECYANLWDTARSLRALVVPCDPQNLYLLLSAKAADHQALARPLDKALWRRAYPALRLALEAADDRPRFDYYERVRLTRWTKGRVAVVGDAAHAMPPTIGQGAGTAMTNALDLATALADCSDPVAALSRWERTQRPATDDTQAISVGRIANLFPHDDDAGVEVWGNEILQLAER